MKGVQWTILTVRENMDFAHDLVLVSYTLQHIQEKTPRLNKSTQQIGLKISQKKTGGH